MKTIEMLRTVHHGDLYLKKGSTREVPAELADRLIKEKSAAAAKGKPAREK